MTISLHEIALYALGMAGLWAVPGPVWVALTARALSGGFAAAWPWRWAWRWAIWSGRWPPSLG